MILTKHSLSFLVDLWGGKKLRWGYLISRRAHPPNLTCPLLLFSGTEGIGRPEESEILEPSSRSHKRQTKRFQLNLGAVVRRALDDESLERGKERPLWKARI